MSGQRRYRCSQIPAGRRGGRHRAAIAQDRVRWATEGKLPFLKTLGGHRRYPAAEIHQLASRLQVQPTA
jgi:hypothetical protein